ncbi:MAG: hypothetical protein K2N73_04090 [Lachnospiraceae bacterium]|nr:hypothetical protein [Lachnospiraceae bacterium]
MKKGKVLGLFAMSAMLLTGCVDSMPELTTEQSEMVAEYAAGLILKYSPNYNYKILSEEEVAAAKADMQEVDESETDRETEQTQAESEEKSGTDLHQEEVPADTEETVAAEIVSSADIDLAAELGIDDVIIRYQSFELCDSYPQGSTGFSVDAAQGKKLLVIHFDLEGSPEEDINCSFFEYQLGIRMKINNISSVSALSTMIPNDLASFMDVVPAGETVDTVIVAEVGEITEQEIHDLTLQMSSNGQSCTVKLK